MAKLADEVIEDIQDRWDLFDKVGDKCIGSDQVVEVLRSMGMNPITSDVKKMIKASDLENKRVDQATFCSMYQQFAAQPVIATIEDMTEAFKTFDKNNSGNMSAAALRAMLVNMGDTLSQEQADTILTKYEDENGLISYVHMCKSIMAAEPAA